MSVVDLETVKKAIRVFHNEDDELITTYVEAAEKYLNRVGVAVAAPIDPDAKVAVLLLCGQLYQWREPVVDGIVKELPLSLRTFITALRGIQL
ncbi:phage gp6-like head-tail connector protein [Agrobacterium rhizogenes]|uniref:head-tail connector protein n=1 Tax=Rhizobium rhizogenes TaxID=359 RepID=UPI001573D9D2|nr:head-tail connector protein [Rhizobium rhizogenes]NTH12277.1 phage gp6-like head-tail connector protein [Rhizobium rhizogenes]